MRYRPLKVTPSHERLLFMQHPLRAGSTSVVYVPRRSHCTGCESLMWRRRTG
jgi:hypothetical protein